MGGGSILSGGLDMLGTCEVEDVDDGYIGM